MRPGLRHRVRESGCPPSSAQCSHTRRTACHPQSRHRQAGTPAPAYPPWPTGRPRQEWPTACSPTGYPSQRSHNNSLGGPLGTPEMTGTTSRRPRPQRHPPVKSPQLSRRSSHCDHQSRLAIAAAIRRSDSAMFRITDPVTSATSACRAEATSPAPYRSALSPG
jgi:hypothetical protein